MSGRVYKVPINNLTMTSSGKVDLWDISCGSSVPILIEEIRIDPDATSVAVLSVALTRFTTFTAASGGTSLTPQPCNYGDVASSALAQVLTTSLATSTNTSTALNVAKQVIDSGYWNLVNGWNWQPIDPDHRITVTSGGMFQVQMQTTTASSALMSGCLTFREML